MKHRSRGAKDNPDQLCLALSGRREPDDEESGDLLRLEGRRRHLPTSVEEDPFDGPPAPAA